MFKKVYSQVPACSIGHTVNNTLSCLKCDMMHIGSSMKLFVPEDQPVPVRAEVDKTALEAGEKITCKVTFDLDLAKEDIKVVAGEGIKIESTEVADKVATVVGVAEAGIYGPRSIMVGHKTVQKMFSVTLVKPAATQKPGVVSIKAEPTEIEVGGKSVITVGFDKALTEEDELPKIEVTEGLSVDSEFALKEDNKKEAEATVAGTAANPEGTVTAVNGEEKTAVKVAVKEKAAKKK